MRLNLGCGRFPLGGWINVDRDPDVACDVRHDLNVIPYPFEPGAADEILASHVLEHLEDPFAAMAEWARLLRPGATLTVRVPHFSRGFAHPDHRRGFDVSFPLYFRPSFAGGFCGTPLECVQLRLRWLGQPELKRRELGRIPYALARAAGGWLDLWANLAPGLASRLWCFWVGGFDEVEYVFRRPAG